MLTHEDIWRGIDRLARHAQTSPSGLARRAGLDSTTFNPSKRVSADGKKARWPSTESIAKALAAANLGFDDFAGLISGQPRTSALPSRGLADGGTSDPFDAAGLPVGADWEAIPFPGLAPGEAYALTVQDETMLPVYRPGDRLVVSHEAPTRVGDRVIIQRRDGSRAAWTLAEKTVQGVRLTPLDPLRPCITLPLTHIAWIARIVWVSQ
ncbi:helix-turn-helix transcriptional regulator [Maricaulis sp.]|uniref:S24 family peptidase n=1 Tax=Maricaulis sp. TaxID=1486257 RepID=UPI0025BBC947|nr:helix-turn-helix transcriptional regulator [Maricaulis sp.]